MSVEFDVMALAAEASSILVAEATRTSWQGLRGAVAHFFRRDGEESRERQLAILDRAHEPLSSEDADVRTAAHEALGQQWLIQVAGYLQRFPEAADELRALLTQTGAAAEAREEASSIVAKFNTGSVVLQARGNIDAGSGGINYNTPRRSS
ncbi:hypothetical protein [Streptacidiphilus cavernicola]|uniref:Uncharacterized protein n=1 Tax=Streptacidiphilus cavernicola TaxID=3342716 RepID=A0ABV6VMT3_9ACTN